MPTLILLCKYTLLSLMCILKVRWCITLTYSFFKLRLVLALYVCLVFVVPLLSFLQLDLLVADQEAGVREGTEQVEGDGQDAQGDEQHAEH